MIIQSARPAAPRTNLSLEKIDTPLEAALTPLLDPAVISLIPAANGPRQFDIDGSIAAANGTFPYKLRLQVNFDGSSVNGSMQGTFAGMPLNVNLTTQGFTFFERGTIGQNAVDLSNSYNIFSGQVQTTGKIGDVSLDVTSSRTTSDGQVGDAPTHVQVGGGTVDGNLGAMPIHGTITRLDGRTQKLTETIGDVQVAETLVQTARAPRFLSQGL